MRVIEVNIQGESPKVSDFLSKFDDKDVQLNIDKDQTKGDSENYVVSINYNETKISDPVTLVQKSLPKGVTISTSKSQACIITDELQMLKDSVPKVPTLTQFVELDEVLGNDLNTAVNHLEDVEFNTNSVNAMAFLELMKLIFSRTLLSYEKFTLKNKRYVDDLCTRALQDLREENKDYRSKELVIHTYKLAYDTVFNSVQEGKVTLSSKCHSSFGLDLSRLISQRKETEDESIRSYISKKLEQESNKVKSENTNIKLEEFRRSKSFIDEVQKILDDVSNRSHEQVTSMYLDALRECSKIDEPIEKLVDISWDSYKTYYNAKGYQEKI